MDASLADLVQALAGLAALAAFVGGIAVWVWIVRRKRRGAAVVRFEPRRPVPWNGLDILLLLAIYFLIASAMLLFATGLLGWELERDMAAGARAIPEADLGEDAADSPDALELERAHPIVVLLVSRPGQCVFLLSFFAVVVMAPIAEEFFFRLVLQGWLEKIDSRCRRVFRYSARLVGIGPVVLSSLLFAIPHARTADPPPSAEYLVRMLTIDMLVKSLLLIAGVAYLVRIRGATREDLGLRLDRLGEDARLALGAFAALIIPVYAIQWGLGRLLPETVPDPIPLFLLGLGLGYLYLRTHRLAPVILMHMIFNAAALVVLFATIAAR